MLCAEMDVGAFVRPLQDCPVVLHSVPDSVHHMPSRVLLDAQAPRNLTGRGAVLRVADHPHRRQPLVQAEFAILEYRTDLDRELLAAALTLPNLTGAYVGRLNGAT